MSKRIALTRAACVAAITVGIGMPDLLAQTNALSCPTEFCKLEFHTNAGWEQRVKITNQAARFKITLTGQGEKALHYSAFVPRGSYRVTAWHNKPKVGWALSDLVLRSEGGSSVARADDGGTPNHRIEQDDNDYNDAVVTLSPVR